LKLKEAIEILGENSSLAIAENLANTLNIAWAAGPSVIFKAIAADNDRIPGNIGSDSDDEHAAIKKWLLKYQTGKDKRASQRTSNPPGTVSDPMLSKIIAARITSLSTPDLDKIISGHRLSMSAENILGLLLEEYLANNLEPHGWFCAWGETIKSVDFVHNDGRLLQIKNRSNSENSSSSAVRSGTQIQKWYRIEATKIETKWDSLNTICGTNRLSESSFSEFVKTTLLSNPSCLAVEEDNSWQ